MVSILATLASIVISMLMMPGFVLWAKASVNNTLSAATASQQIIVNKAAQQYVQDNGLAIAALATATTPVTVTAQMLINAGYLPTGSSTTNAFMQTWQAQVLQPSSGVLQTVVMSTGGRAISNTRQLVQIAAQSGAQGGFVPYTGQNGDATMSPSNAYGAYGAWKLAPVAGFTNPGSGHLFSLLAFTNTQTNNSYLYRVQVANHTELNAMQTDLGLTDTGGTRHNINGAQTVNADTLQATGGGQLNSDQGGSLELGGNNSQAGTGTPYIDFHQAGQGVQDYNARIVNDSNSHLKIEAANGQGSLSVQGTIQPGNIATPGTACSSTAIAGNSDGSGQILSCQYGQWFPIGGHKLWYGYYAVSSGSIVPRPTCPQGGTPAIMTVPQSFTVDSTAIVNYITNGSGGWTVAVQDGARSPINATGVVATFCDYQ
jgi:hypothetical protein